VDTARLDVLRGVTRHMATAEDLETVLRSITTALVDRADATVAHIFLYLHDQECPVCRTQAAPGPMPPDDQRALHLLAGAGVPFGVGEPVHRVARDSRAPSAELIRTATPVMLQNVLERACVLANGPVVSIGDTLRVAAGVTPAGGSPDVPAPLQTLEESERDHIRRALTAAAGRVHGPLGAAELLGINPSTLRSRMQKLGITTKAF